MQCPRIESPKEPIPSSDNHVNRASTVNIRIGGRREEMRQQMIIRVSRFRSLASQSISHTFYALFKPLILRAIATTRSRTAATSLDTHPSFAHPRQSTFEHLVLAIGTDSEAVRLSAS